MPGRDGGADGRGEQHWRTFRLALVPRRNQPLGVFEHLRISRAPAGRFLVGLGLPGIFHFAFVEAHRCPGNMNHNVSAPYSATNTTTSTSLPVIQNT